MASIEKTVFISYRRIDVYTALAVYQELHSEGYDVFFDYRSIHSGNFEQIIVKNIKARAHFILILTPNSLDRCKDPKDWLRREIELAIDEKRNIVPLFFQGFKFETVVDKLPGKLRELSKFNGLEVYPGYFKEALDRLCNGYLDTPVEAVVHPVLPEEEEDIQEKQQIIENDLKDNKIKEQVDQAKVRSKNIEEQKSSTAVIVALIGFLGIVIAGFLSSPWVKDFIATPTTTPSITVSMTVETSKEIPAKVFTSTVVISPTVATSIPELSIGKDGMQLILIPTGEFLMGSEGNESDERPVHTVYLDDFLIDQTEVTNTMYALCVEAGICEPPRKNESHTQNSSIDGFYYGNPDFANNPVIYVSWMDARRYCSWVGRRLPTEAEWEKAASWNDSQQTKRLYPWGGNKIDCSYANYYGDDDKLCIGDTTPVGSYPKGGSFYGVFDMAGNVWEWVADRYDPEYYSLDVIDNPIGPKGGVNVVRRGGSFLTGRANGIRSSDRGFNTPDFASKSIGFRCVMDLP